MGEKELGGGNRISDNLLEKKRRVTTGVPEGLWFYLLVVLRMGRYWGSGLVLKSSESSTWKYPKSCERGLSHDSEWVVEQQMNFKINKSKVIYLGGKEKKKAVIADMQLWAWN